jgi:DNA-binding MarR family transcriptional regulator
MVTQIELETIQQDKDAALLEELNQRICWVSRRWMQQDLEIFRLTIPQYRSLLCLQGKPNGCSMSELAEGSHQVSATMTGIVDRLFERKLVERIGKRDDRRATIVVLTPAGQALLEQISQAKKHVMHQVLSDLSSEERQSLIKSTSRYLEVLENTLEKA